MMEQAWFSIFVLIRSWLTPAVIFLLLNFIIGTIALTSKTLLAHRHHDDVRSTASHVLHHMRSLSLPRFRSGNFFLDPTTEVVKTTNTEVVKTTNTEVVKKEDEQLICRSQSETQHKPAEKGKSLFEMKQTVKLNKALEEVTVDARADDFISRFRRQLHLQRLDSLLKYKEIMNSGN